VGAPHIWRYQHMNETNNETAANETAEDGNITALLDTVEESGMLDALMDEPLLMALAAMVLAMGAYVAYTVPAVKELVFKYLKNNEAELMDMLDKNLTKAQMKAFEKLDETAQKHVKDSLVRNVLVTAWDEKDDELAALVKSKVKSALDEGKSL
jgi:DNA-directed RNA polymerase subunit F